MLREAKPITITRGPPLRVTNLQGEYCDHFFTTLTHLKLVEIFISYETPYFSHQRTEI